MTYVTSLTAPGMTDPTHFRHRDEVQFGYDTDAPPCIITVAQPDEHALVGIHMYGEDTRTHIANLLHRNDCQPCDQFKQAWDAEQEQSWQEERADYTPAALQLADTLRDQALIQISTTGLSCGHGDIYVLSADAPLPDWLHRALAGAEFTAPEGPWPNWGRTDHPVDWPTLITTHPQTLTADQDMLDCNFGCSWASIAQAITLVRSIDPHTHIDVCFWVDETGRITIEPIGFWAHTDLPADIATRVDDILVAGGRERDALHNDPYGDEGLFRARRGWRTEC